MHLFFLKPLHSHALILISRGETTPLIIIVRHVLPVILGELMIYLIDILASLSTIVEEVSPVIVGLDIHIFFVLRCYYRLGGPFIVILKV
jgi:hypothetical protein